MLLCVLLDWEMLKIENENKTFNWHLEDLFGTIWRFYEILKVLLKHASMAQEVTRSALNDVNPR